MPFEAPAMLALAYLPALLLAAWRYGAEAVRARERNREYRDLVATLRAERRKARAQAKAQASFLSAASIGLRQPMHAVSLYLGALAAGPQTGAQQSELLARAQQSALSLEQLLRALLEVARLDAGAVRPEWQAVDLGALLRKTAAALAGEAAARGQHWRVAPCRMVVKADPALLARLLHLLLQNAMQHAGPCRVLLGCRRRAGRLAVQVLDSGRGIAPHLQQAIFETFSQHCGEAGQRGLGLHIAQRLAQLHGGSLELRARLGAGCCFSFDLEAAPCTQAPRPAATRGLAGALVVAVDDDRFSLDVLAGLLQRFGSTVVACTSGAQASTLLENSGRRPDLIVADYRLDGETGLDVIAALRDEFNYDIPALLATGHGEARHLEPAGLPVLPKPLSETELRAALHQLLNSKVE
jgi:CheY-like chemotaxis protein